MATAMCLCEISVGSEHELKGDKNPLKIQRKYDSFRDENHNSQLEYAR